MGKKEATWNSVCDKCHNQRSCKRPCWPIEYLLSQVTDGSMEKQTGEKELTHFGHHHEKRFSDLNEATLKKAVYEIADEDPFDPFEPSPRYDDLEFQPTQKTADIFYMRFFLGKSYLEIAEKHGISRRTASSVYSAGRRRVVEVLSIVDGRDKGLKFCAARARNSFSRHEKAFLLNKVFGLAFTEIAELLGYAGPDQISHKVNEMYRGYRERHFRQADDDKAAAAAGGPISDAGNDMRRVEIVEPGASGEVGYNPLDT